MKSFLCFLFFYGWMATGLSQTFHSPDEYLAYIKAQEVNITKSSWKLVAAKAHKNWIRAYDAQKQLLKDIQSAKKKIAKIKDGYKGDVEYRDQILLYFDLYEKSVNREFQKIISLDTLHQQSNDVMDALMQVDDMVDNKLNAQSEKVDTAYKAFIEKYAIEPVVIESEWSKKIKIFNEASNYHMSINAQYFKANFTHVNLMIAVKNADIPAIQQNSNALVQYADEGLEQLEAIGPYNGDYSIKNAAAKVLQYYKENTREFTTKVLGMIMFSDKFDNSKKLMESKKKEEITADEESNYNQLLKQMETEIKAFRKMYFDVFTANLMVVNQWLAAESDFFARQVPKD